MVRKYLEFLDWHEPLLLLFLRMIRKLKSGIFTSKLMEQLLPNIFPFYYIKSIDSALPVDLFNRIVPEVGLGEGHI